MIEDSSKLIKGQKLKVDLERVRDRLPLKMLEYLNNDSTGELVGYKMVDGNQFGFAIKFRNGNTAWFFEDELFEEID